VLRFELSAETFATFREAMAKLRRDTGSRLDDDAALLLLARQTLGGPTEPGRANYQIALSVCEECGRGWQQGRGEMVEVGSEVVEMASCDAQHLGRIQSGPAAHVGARATRARQDVPPAVRRLVMRRDGGRCVVPGCAQGVFLYIHHVVPRSEGGDHDPEAGCLVLRPPPRTARGKLIVEGRISTSVQVSARRRVPYGLQPSPRSCGSKEKRSGASRRFSEARRWRAPEWFELKGTATPSIQGILRQYCRLAFDTATDGDGAAIISIFIPVSGPLRTVSTFIDADLYEAALPRARQEKQP
jgi:hypothetical protein